MEKAKKEKKGKESQKRCPFVFLECEDCRLYVVFAGGEKGQRQCALILAGIR